MICHLRLSEHTTPHTRLHPDRRCLPARSRYSLPALVSPAELRRQGARRCCWARCRPGMARGFFWLAPLISSRMHSSNSRVSVTWRCAPTLCVCVYVCVCVCATLLIYCTPRTLFYFKFIIYYLYFQDEKKLRPHTFFVWIPPFRDVCRKEKQIICFVFFPYFSHLYFIVLYSPLQLAESTTKWALQQHGVLRSGAPLLASVGRGPMREYIIGELVVSVSIP
jgi:hypothetical protein